MAIGLRQIRHCRIRGPEGELGRLHDLLMDDTCWRTQFVVMDCSDWFPGRRVLVPSTRIERLNIKEGAVRIGLNREQIGSTVATSQGISPGAQSAREISEDTGSEPLWVAGVSRGDSSQRILPGQQMRLSGLPSAPAEGRGGEQMTAIRSARGFVDDAVVNESGVIGAVTDVAFTNDATRITYIILKSAGADSSTAIHIDWVRGIDWLDKRLEIEFENEEVWTAPAVESAESLTDDLEQKLRTHFGR